MTLPAPTYDLVMLLDPQAEDAARAKLVSDARAAIEKQGELLRHDEWGDRPLAYPIERKTSAEYHLLQFHVAKPELLTGLDRSLQIADDVLRFRIIKLAPGVPDAPDMRASSPAARRPEGEREQPPATSAEPLAASEAAATPPAEPSSAPAEPGPATPEPTAPATPEPAALAASDAEADAPPDAAPAEPSEPAAGEPS
jgi:small subunit ribosomal protein S6